MTGVHIIALVAAVVTLTVIIELSRRSQLRNKYTVVWLLVGLVIAVFAIAPGMFNYIAHGVGVKSPPNLLVVVAALFLLMVCVYLSWEAGRQEDKTRVLAEEVALLRNELEERTALPAPSSPPGSPSPGSDPQPS
ncbi:MAG TPA: DUF2304 domain-containing protein [Acidimicrobiales bacterium]|jgi:hypothetical protein|nr:DUF2304 domain-containing protein [Acidimicrobiales bacterium]